MTDSKMAVFSKLGTQWNASQTATGEVKICVLGLTMTSDSPKFLLLTVTCGLVSATLISRVSRAFLWRVWKSACQWCAFLSPPLPPAADPDNSNNPKTALSHVKSVAKMGQKMTVITSVQLSTDPFEPELDLLTSYEIIDRPRLRARMRDAQTSPIHQARLVGCGTDVGLGTLGLVETQDRSTSPVSSSMFESGSPDDLLLMFEGEESEVLRDESGLPLQEGEGSELYEKLGSIQKALQEANQEMDSYMSTLSEISQRHFCSPIHTSRTFPPGTEPFLASSTELNDVLTWEDEFGSNSPPRSAQAGLSTPNSHRRSSHPATSLSNPNLENIPTWRSDFRFYRGLSFGNHHADTNVETDSPIHRAHFTDDNQSIINQRDSGCGDLWDSSSQSTINQPHACDAGCGDAWDVGSMEPGPDEASSRVCLTCRTQQRRPVSAPSGCAGFRQSVNTGDVLCDLNAIESSSSPVAFCFSCGRGHAAGAAAVSLSNDGSPDRVPKSRSLNRNN